MMLRTLLVPLLFGFAVGCGGGNVVDQPYESCAPSDGCTTGTACLSTTLPANSGYTGSLCTNSCNVDSDCLVDVTNYNPVCVNSQCYLQCPSGSSTCPYGTSCLEFSDQSGNAIDICTP